MFAWRPQVRSIAIKGGSGLHNGGQYFSLNQPATGFMDNYFSFVQNEQGSDLIELRLTWGKLRIRFVGDLSGVLENFWRCPWFSLGQIWLKV